MKINPAKAQLDIHWMTDKNIHTSISIQDTDYKNMIYSVTE